MQMILKHSNKCSELTSILFQLTESKLLPNREYQLLLIFSIFSLISPKPTFGGRKEGKLQKTKMIVFYF